MAVAALNQRLAGLLLAFRQIRELDTPEIYLGVEEGDTVDISVAAGANLSNHASLDFLVGLLAANHKFLLGGEFVRRLDAGTMTAEKDGLGTLGEHAPLDVAADESDSDLFGNAATATCALWRHDSMPFGGREANS